MSARQGGLNQVGVENGIAGGDKDGVQADEPVQPVEESPEEQAEPAPATPTGGDLPGPVEEPLPAEADEEQETTTRRVARDPGLPTQSERDDHCIDHTPFRSWCEDCVRGRATGEQHRSSTRPRATPVISFDYLFVTRGQLLRRSELEQSDDADAMLKILVVKCSHTKAVFGHVVEKKGG